MTIAMSLLIHGEAVRFNRGQSRGDDYDFKYLRGRDGREFPYVSSQCYKKYWRESLPYPFSPITREKDASGKEKNQAHTDGNPISFVDDDLFGYMIAGATESGEDGGGMAAAGPCLFEAENIKDIAQLRTRLLDSSPLSQFILDRSQDKRGVIENPEASLSDVQSAALDALDEAARSEALSGVGGIEAIKGTKQLLGKIRKITDRDELHQINKELLLKAFSKELQDKPKRPTTKRTALVRMHALVAFSGIKLAKDFQTFSRDVAYTGKNSIVNPAAQGIYSGWLKTRILIESHRIGKFYIGENMDILDDLAQGQTIKTEPNPYSPNHEPVRYVELDTTERTNRLRAVLQALADIGNRQGPASGALHDGSLRPQAFVAGLMNCADSPFDYIWIGHNGDSMPYLDVNLLCDSVKDFEDLFAAKRIYVGLPVDAVRAYRSSPTTAEAVSAAKEQTPAQETKGVIEAGLKSIGFEAVVDTPRKALLRLAKEAVL
jgi:hypothetical protein